MPPKEAAGDPKNWSVRSFDRESGAVDDIAVNSVDVDIHRRQLRQLIFAKKKVVDPQKVGTAKKFVPAKGSKDADIYVAGAVTAGVGAKPNYTLETKAGVPVWAG